jgi:putative transposase
MAEGHESNALQTGAGVTPALTGNHGKIRRPNAKGASGRIASQAVRALAAKPKLKKHSDEEKLAKIKVIEEQIAGGKSTLKDAVKNVGISDETYYKWKRAMAAAASPQATAEAFGDLLKLEEENHRLRQTLADKLRHENAELRRKLGLSD